MTNKPPTEEELKLYRKKNREEKMATKATYNMFLYLLFLFVLFGASYLRRDLRSFHYKWNLENYLLVNDSSRLGFSGVRILLNIKHKIYFCLVTKAANKYL